LPLYAVFHTSKQVLRSAIDGDIANFDVWIIFVLISVINIEVLERTNEEMYNLAIYQT